MTFPRVALRDVCKSVEYGYTASASNEAIGPHFLRITDIVPDRIDWTRVPFCNIEPKKLAKHRLEAGDIVIARTGATTGWAKYISSPPEAVFASYLVRIRPDDSMDPRYVGFVVESSIYKEFVQQHMGGAAQPNANAQVLTSFDIPVPPLPIQKRIAGVLSAYDELIENNQRRIRILEDMARSLYREWFVHFRYPGHESVPLIDSPLGPIPQGWELQPFAECIGIRPSVRVPREGEKSFVPMGSLSNNSMLIENIETRSGNSGAKFQNGDTLFARITPCLENGKTGYVQFLADNNAVAFGSTEFIVLRSKTVTPEYVYCLARSNEFREHAIKSMTGASGRQRVQESCFGQLIIPQPPESLLDKFCVFAAPNFRLIHRLHEKVCKLKETRILLLPKLLSGEVAVETSSNGVAL